MSVKAFVLIEVDTSKNLNVLAALKGIEGVTTANIVTGPYDVIAVINRDKLEEIGSVIAEKIQPIPGVARVVSCLARNEAIKKD